jgi:PAS domain S-box-containing protein
MEVLKQMPALVVLERMPVPVLAIGQDGSILFANQAFAEMIGHPAQTVLEMKFPNIFRTEPADDSALAVMHAHAGLLVELAHAEGSTVLATMSKSALLRGDDPVALATFNDLTERLWTDGR